MQMVQRFNKVRSIIPSTHVTTTATPKSIQGNCTVMCITGNLWIDPTTDATAATGYKITAGQSINLFVTASLSLISDATGADFQIIIYQD